MLRKRSQYYFPERNKGRMYSIVMHLLFLLIAYTGLPSFLRSHPPEEPHAITVELLPVTGITNVKPAEKLADTKPEKPEEKKAQAKPSPPVKTAENTPPPEPVPGKKPDKLKDKEKEKPKDKKPEKKEPKAKTEDLDAVLKAVKATAQEKKAEEKKDTTPNASKSVSNSYNPSLPMSLSEQDAIRGQIQKCWNIPAGAKDAQNLVVDLHIELAQDGTVLKVELANASRDRYTQDTFFRAAADSAIRAVRQCSPLKNLPPEKYGTWQSMDLTFDPKEMLQ